MNRGMPFCTEMLLCLTTILQVSTSLARSKTFGEWIGEKKTYRVLVVTCGDKETYDLLVGFAPKATSTFSHVSIDDVDTIRAHLSNKKEKGISRRPIVFLIDRSSPLWKETMKEESASRTAKLLREEVRPNFLAKGEDILQFRANDVCTIGCPASVGPEVTYIAAISAPNPETLRKAVEDLMKAGPCNTKRNLVIRDRSPYHCIRIVSNDLSEVARRSVVSLPGHEDVELIHCKDAEKIAKIPDYAHEVYLVHRGMEFRADESTMKCLENLGMKDATGVKGLFCAKEKQPGVYRVLVSAPNPAKFPEILSQYKEWCEEASPKIYEYIDLSQFRRVGLTLRGDPSTVAASVISECRSLVLNALNEFWPTGVQSADDIKVIRDQEGWILAGDVKGQIGKVTMPELLFVLEVSNLSQSTQFSASAPRCITPSPKEPFYDRPLA